MRATYCSCVLPRAECRGGPCSSRSRVRLAQVRGVGLEFGAGRRGVRDDLGDVDGAADARRRRWLALAQPAPAVAQSPCGAALDAVSTALRRLRVVACPYSPVRSSTPWPPSRCRRAAHCRTSRRAVADRRRDQVVDRRRGRRAPGARANAVLLRVGWAVAGRGHGWPTLGSGTAPSASMIYWRQRARRSSGKCLEPACILPGGRCSPLLY
jgi:hypothetical protein